MSDCIVYINAGRNCSGILADTVAWLKSSRVRAVVLVCRSLDEASWLDLHGLNMPVFPIDRDGSAPDSEVVGHENPVHVYVLNGGTTQQQWWMMREYAQHRMEGVQGDEFSTSFWQDQHPEPSRYLILDVQKDGVEVLDSHGCPDLDTHV